MDTKGLKVGDKVLHMGRGGTWSPDRAYEAIITRVWPSGRVAIGERVFNPDGSQRGRSYYECDWLEPFDQTVIDKQARVDLIARKRRVLADIAWRRELSDKLILKIAEMVATEKKEGD
jgi:hypothetical protein